MAIHKKIMGIKNYSTSIKTEKTAAEIQMLLAKAGARAVMSEYDDNGIMESMAFRVNNVYFQLPINVDGVYAILKKDRSIPKKFRTYEQASRTALRNIKDWVDAQISIIQAGQADLVQVFLPYAQDQSGKTLYEAIKDNNFKQIMGK